MNTDTMKFVIVALSLLVAGPSMAQDNRWTLRGIASFATTSSGDARSMQTLPVPLGQETLTQNVSSGPGGGLSFEYRWNERIGIEGMALLSFHDTDMVITNDLGNFSARDTTQFRIFTLGANYYFEPSDKIQWSVGGFLPLLFADGSNHLFPGLNRTEARAYDQDYGLGIKAAMDWSLSPGSRWALTIGARYIFLLIMEAESGGDVDFDPLLLSVGLGYRF